MDKFILYATQPFTLIRIACFSLIKMFDFGSRVFGIVVKLIYSSALHNSIFILYFLQNQNFAYISFLFIPFTPTTKGIPKNHLLSTLCP